MPESISNKKYWFRAKRYGLGWGLPASWQGWATMILYLASVIGTFKFIKREDHRLVQVLLIIGLSALFIFICWKKGEPTGWRWGDKKDDEDDK